MLKKRKLSYLQVQLLAWLPLTWRGQSSLLLLRGSSGSHRPHPRTLLAGWRRIVLPCGLPVACAHSRGEGALCHLVGRRVLALHLAFAGSALAGGYGVVVVVGVPRYSLLSVEI